MVAPCPIVSVGAIIPGIHHWNWCTAQRGGSGGVVSLVQTWEGGALYVINDINDVRDIQGLKESFNTSLLHQPVHHTTLQQLYTPHNTPPALHTTQHCNSSTHHTTHHGSTTHHTTLHTTLHYTPLHHYTHQDQCSPVFLCKKQTHFCAYRVS